MSGTILNSLTRSFLMVIFALILVTISICHAQEASVKLPDNFKVNRILFLGNSITLHGIVESYGWLINCGMASSIVEKDHVHLLTRKLEEATGTKLRIANSRETTTDADGSEIRFNQNIVNIADIFERNYATYNADRLRQQLNMQPEIVIMQFGENTPRDTLDTDAFKVGLQRLLDDLKNHGNPHIFVGSQLLGNGGVLEELKQQVCAEDPEHRVYVDMNDFGADPTNFASAEPYYTGIIVGHPGDKGMQYIADHFFAAIVEHFSEIR